MNRKSACPPARFEQLFNLSPDAILITNPEGIIEDLNTQAEEMFGYSREELCGQRIEVLVPERFRAGHPGHRADFDSHPRTRSMGAGPDLFGLRKDRSEFAVDIMLRPIDDQGSPLVLCLVRDVSKQRAAQDLLRQKDQQLSSIIESVNDYAIFLLDPTGHVATWNPGAERIKGYRADEILGQHFSRFYGQEDVEQGKPQEEIKIATAKGRFEAEGWRIRKDGSRFWANVIITAIRDKQNRLTGFAKVTRDFTDRKRAEEALLLQLSSVLLANVDIRKMLSAISASLRDVVPHDCATMALHDWATGQAEGAVPRQRREQ